MGTQAVLLHVKLKEHGKQRWRTVNRSEPSKGPPTNVFGFKEDEVERRKALYTNQDTTKVSTRGAPSPRASRGSARHIFLVKV